MKLFPSWCCQYCGEHIGWLGRMLAKLLPRWHVCKDESKQTENLGI
jgi:hypothetical protein